MSSYKREWFHLDRYTGPGTKYKGKAYTPLEKASKLHDKQYTYLKEPYTRWSAADERHLASARSIRGWKARAVTYAWRVKKLLTKYRTRASSMPYSRKRKFSYYADRSDLPSNVKRRRYKSTAPVSYAKPVGNGAPESFSKMPYRKKTFKRYKKRTKTRGNSKLARTIKRVSNRAAKMSRQQEVRLVTNRNLTSPINIVGTLNNFCYDRTGLLNVLDQTVPVFDGVAIRWNDIVQTRASGKFHLLPSSYEKLTIRNNQNLPANLELNWMIPKSHLDVDPNTVYENRLTNVAVDSTQTAVANAENSMMFSWKDIRTNLWSKSKTVRMFLNPGQQKSVIFFYKKASCSLEDLVQHTELFVKGISQGLFIRQYGVPTHDSVTETSTGIGSTNLDVIIRCSLKYKIENGIEARKIEYTETLDAQTVAEAVVPEIEDVVG